MTTLTAATLETSDYVQFASEHLLANRRKLHDAMVGEESAEYIEKLRSLVVLCEAMLKRATDKRLREIALELA